MNADNHADNRKNGNSKNGNSKTGNGKADNLRTGNRQGSDRSGRSAIDGRESETVKPGGSRHTRTQESSARTSESSARTMKSPACTQRGPEHTQEKTERTQEKTARTQESPAPMDESAGESFDDEQDANYPAKERSGLSAAAAVCLCLVVALLSFIAGTGAGISIARRGDDADTHADAVESQTFYAAITDIEGSRLTVKGLDVNDVNFRGAFIFSVDSGTTVEWQGTQISSDDLEKGDNISVTFTGAIRESYPAQIDGVTRIVVLDDEL